jgi:adenine-specific DNA-methyltransferase
VSVAPPHRVEHAEALAFLRSLPESSVGLVLTDPPYFKVKPHGWDRQWSKRDGFLDWLDTIAAEWARVLRPNGTLVCFAGGNPTGGATTAARVEVRLAERFDVVASCVWVKQDAYGNGQHSKQHRPLLRSHFPQTERAIICEHYGADSIAKGEAGYAAKCDELRGFVFEPLRAYLDGERERAGLSRADTNAAWCAARGVRRSDMASHWFSRGQWALPTREHYGFLRDLFNAEADGDHLRREYDHLRREYDDLRREYDDLRAEFEHLRRPFDATAGRHFTDVWTYPTVPARKGKHPCEKPREMAEDLVRQCSRPGDVVLDTFAGSGVFLSAAASLGRVAWGCDFQANWADAARAAVTVAAGSPLADGVRPDAPAKVEPAQVAQLSLL